MNIINYVNREELKMKDILDVIVSRRSVKNYKSDMVSNELIEKVKRRMRERDTWQGKKYIEDKI